MRFELSSVKYFFTVEYAETLSKYGFEFSTRDIGDSDGSLCKSNKRVFVHVHSLGDLREISEHVDADLVVSFRDSEVTIYDNYLE